MAYIKLPLNYISSGTELWWQRYLCTQGKSKKAFEQCFQEEIIWWTFHESKCCKNILRTRILTYFEIYEIFISIREFEQKHFPKLTEWIQSEQNHTTSNTATKEEGMRCWGTAFNLASASNHPSFSKARAQLSTVRLFLCWWSSTFIPSLAFQICPSMYATAWAGNTSAENFVQNWFKRGIRKEWCDLWLGNSAVLGHKQALSIQDNSHIAFINQALQL